MIAQLDHVDDPDVLERIATNPALHHALEMARPRNWWGTCIDPKLLFSIARDDGIPVAWVPPGGDASRTRCGAGRCSATRCVARSAGGDCGGLLEGARRVPRDPWLDDDVTLARKAIAAYRDGHHEAAMALAVSVGEPLATWASKGRVRSFDSKADRDAWEKDRKNFKKKYHWAKDELGIVGLDVSRLVFKQQVLMAPIPRFFTPWFPEGGDPPPEFLSRHVVVHQPMLAHFSVENALVAIMLVASILREQQAGAEEVRSMDIEAED